MRQVLLAVTTVLLAATGSAAERPNFVVIVADDLGWNDVAWHGGSIPTPRLDRFCRDGVELLQHYVSPMCSPTRAALLSGRYASRFGCTGAQNERVFPFGTETLAGALKQAGYDTALVGKWHLGSLPEWGPNHFGFDHSYGSLAGGCGPYDHHYKKGPYTETWHRNGERIHEEGHITDLITREAVRWIGERTDKPFFLYVPFTAPHIPIKEPAEWLDRFSHIGEPDRRQYAACIAHLDDAVGQIADAVDRAGKLESTAIIFFSDNGGTTARNDDPAYPADDYTPGRSHGSNQPLRGHKTQLYEGGIRVPAFIHWKGKLPPGRFQTPMHAADWMPTLCALAGYESPGKDLGWDGANLWPALGEGKSIGTRRLYWAGTGFRTAAVREGDWKLIVHRMTDRAELFDLAADPNETDDRTTDEPQRVERLRELLVELAARDNDARIRDE